MFAYNNTDLDGLGLTPYQLMFTRDARLPLDLMASPDHEFEIDHHHYHLWHTRALRDVTVMVQAFQKHSVARSRFPPPAVPARLGGPS